MIVYRFKLNPFNTLNSIRFLSIEIGANMSAVTHIELPGIHKFKSGKVREVYDLGDQYLFIASDRFQLSMYHA